MESVSTVARIPILVNFAPVKFALLKLAPFRFAPMKIVLVKFAPEKSAPSTLALSKFSPDKSNPYQCSKVLFP